MSPLSYPNTGICFGHQIVARALGGSCVPNDGRWEIGPCEVEMTDLGKQIFGLDFLVSILFPLCVHEIFSWFAVRVGLQGLGYAPSIVAQSETCSPILPAMRTSPNFLYTSTELTPIIVALIALAFTSFHVLNVAKFCGTQGATP